MARAEDLGQYYRIPADNRDLNYHQFSDRGDLQTTEALDYTSENTERLDIEGIISLITSLPYIAEEISTLKKGM